MMAELPDLATAADALKQAQALLDAAQQANDQARLAYERAEDACHRAKSLLIALASGKVEQQET